MEWKRIVLGGLLLALIVVVLTMILFVIGGFFLIVGTVIQKEIIDFLKVFQNQ